MDALPAPPTGEGFAGDWSEMMVSDPRIGLTVSLFISGVAAVWLIVQFVFDAELATALGMTRHAVTYFSIVVLVFALVTTLVFAQFHRVRSELLAGRHVLAEWRVDFATFTRFAADAERQDHTEKRGALLLVLAFTALIFGGFAVFDPEAAPGMLGIGAAFAAVVGTAFLYGRRVSRIQMQPRSDSVIVGRRGLMMNGILHVWAVPLTWLVGAKLADRPPATLSVSYAVLGRFGPQVLTITLPVPAEALPEAQRAARGLNARRRKAR